MPLTTVALIVILLAVYGYFLGKRRAWKLAGDGAVAGKLHSLPAYHGSYVALWAALPSLVVLLCWSLFGQAIIDQMALYSLPAERLEGADAGKRGLLLATIKNTAFGGGFASDDPVIIAAAEYMNSLQASGQWAVGILALALSLMALAFAARHLAPQFQARHRVERTAQVLMILCSVIAIITTFGIVISLFFESLRFFERYSIIDFVFGLKWSPQTAIREDQVGSSGAFGAVPVFMGTMLIAAIAMAVAVPIGLLSAIYLSEYAPSRIRGSIKPVLEVLAGIPTIVYGFFAALTVAPAFRQVGEVLGLPVSANSALAAGSVMGIMIIPFVSSLSDDAIRAVPQSLREGSAGLGATKSETIRQVIFPAALPGIVGAILLAVSRAVGETMIVVMAAGLSANLTLNPLEQVTTVTVQIVANLTGDTAFDSAKTLSAFALGFMLFLTTLCLNVMAILVVRRYREKYD
ncbi:phosphate ABC transporter permease subunit PstC [Fodinicurvata sediminis]|uniref:phosphate ABC transporter permease subunit PstC n=1 Tax=Fodinicurvata sediminis TaxID=1121832 RepID=UPI0003B4966B|nr:phosphate ABC transporter permease subunit PstC [Fodinicurvata sediminis]